MTLFICEKCGFEMDYDEVPSELIECDECGELMTGIEDEQEIAKGSHVRIISNVKDTGWETGYVVDINEDGALINYGSWQIPIYGMGIRKPLDQLEMI